MHFALHSPWCLQLGGLQHPGPSAEPAGCHGQQEVSWLPQTAWQATTACELPCRLASVTWADLPVFPVGCQPGALLWQAVPTHGALPANPRRSIRVNVLAPRNHAHTFSFCCRLLLGALLLPVSFYLYRPALPVTLRTQLLHDGCLAMDARPGGWQQRALGCPVALLLSRGDHCWAIFNFTYSPLLDPCTNRGAGAFCHTSSESVRSQRRCLSRKTRIDE